MKNFIQIGDKKWTLDPKNPKEFQETFTILTTLAAQCIAILNEDVKDEQKHVEAILKSCGSFGGTIARIIFTNQAFEKAEKEGKVDA